MPSVQFVPSAEASLAEIWLRVAADNPAAADRLIDSIQRTCERLAIFPEMGQDRSDLSPRVRLFSVGEYALIY